MDIEIFKLFINNSEGYIKQLAEIDLVDLKRYVDELRQYFNDFKEGGNTLLKESSLLRIGVVGQVKAGKSSFLNSLFFDGESVLPKASTPMTAGLTVLEYSDKNFFEVEYYAQEDWKGFQDLHDLYCKIEKEVRSNKDLEGAPESFIQKEIKSKTNDIQQSAYELVSRCSATAKRKIGSKPESVEFKGNKDLQIILNQYVGADGEYTSVVKSLHIHMNDERLKGIQIVDTPGVNDPIVSRENRTRQFLYSCHGVFFLSYASRFFDSTDVSFMNTRIGGQGVNAVVLLASKYDDVLQDQGMQYPDDLDRADEMSRKSLEKRYHSQSADIENKSIEIKFDTTSGISYALATKPETDWDEMEKHVAGRMKTIFPSAFSTDEDAKETFLMLANMDVIRQDYLDVLFKQNKDNIIKTKIENYFSLNTINLAKILSDAIERMSDKQKEINVLELSALKKQKENQDKMFKKLKGELQTMIKGFQNDIQARISTLRENIAYPECYNNLPQEDTLVDVTFKGDWWGTNTEEFPVKQVNTMELQSQLFSLVDTYVKRWREGWSNFYDTRREQMFKDFNSAVTDFASESQDLTFSDSYYRNLLSQVLSEIDVLKELPLNAILSDVHAKISTQCDQQNNKLSSVNLSDLKRASVQGKLNEMVAKILSNLKGNINNQVLMNFCKEVQIAAEANAKSIQTKLSSLSDNINDQLQIAGEDYIKQLELELKDKEATEKKISSALSVLAQFKKSFNM
ncbi:dynamin family protein [Bacteroides gallinaceum]|uniref:dynamin family protein n=1 Tax=Bacteroides gallinaceum TaxID=1462571 RepID=UPI0019591004|nr:dynamin family protein [Bacteroides gallinaceum]MBM6718705.1 dynamin family protein [Bacteroides gallinaceum]